MPPSRSIDAIFVPTARQPAYLAGAAELAQILGCSLVTLHSGKWTSAAAAARFLLADLSLTDLNLIAIDVPHVAHLNMPLWQTTSILDGTVFASRSDLSAKRNLALTLSRMLDWKRILFLDDDITGLNPDDARAASGLLDIYNAVGLHVGGFPDNSVVCHAYRKAGGGQTSFVGGGALAVHVERASSFFPDIYNDDWFFLLDGDKWLQPTGVTGQVQQYPYDPFRTPDRARAEEFGDVLAEGIYWLLDQDRSIAEADREHWADFLGRRREFIGEVLSMVQASSLEAKEKQRRIAALKGSLGRLALITPGLCEDYLQAWAADRRRWQHHTGRLPTRQQMGSALAKLSRKGSPSLTVAGKHTIGKQRTFSTKPYSPWPESQGEVPAKTPEAPVNAL
jgi:hypothetical protein